MLSIDLLSVFLQINFVLKPQALYESIRKESRKEEWLKSSLSHHKSLVSSQGGWGEDLSCMKSVDKKITLSKSS